MCYLLWLFCSCTILLLFIPKLYSLLSSLMSSSFESIYTYKLLFLTKFFDFVGDFFCSFEFFNLFTLGLCIFSSIPTYSTREFFFFFLAFTLGHISLKIFPKKYFFIPHITYMYYDGIRLIISFLYFLQKNILSLMFLG